MSAQKYRKKPVVIEALQWVGDDDELAAFCPQAERMVISTEEGDEWVTGSVAIKTLEGTMQCDPNDWIIKGVAGEFYPCKPSIFDATYERA